jgi:hypothetical protein
MNKYSNHINSLKENEKLTGEAIIFEKSPWETDLSDFIKALREAKIGSFIFADHSTAAMQTLHALLMADFRVVGAVTIKRQGSFGYKEPIIGLILEA